jgi:hypothetical protein
MNGTDHPPSTNGSPRLARRAIQTGLAALGAVVLPVAMVAATAQAPSTEQPTSVGTPASVLEGRLELVQARANAEATAFRAQAAAAVPAAVAVPTTAAPTTTAPPPPPTTAAPRPAPAPAPAPSGSGSGDPDDPASWDRLAQCESGGNWSINTGNGYYGGLQFSLSSWQGVGGTGYPHEHSRETQIEMGRRLYDQGGWSHWPGCTRSFGWPQ